MKFFDRLKRKYARRRDRLYGVGSVNITLPPYHMLDEYQRLFLNYDRKLPAIAKLVVKKYPDSAIIDIGANVGDTAVALRSAVSVPILCIEGNPKFIPYLVNNLGVIPGENRIIPMFIIPNNISESKALTVRTNDGTAQLLATRSNSHNRAVKNTLTFREIISQNADLGTFRLVKSDTDGFDFSILTDALDSLITNKPILFFEFDPIIGSSTIRDALDLIEGLLRIGYQHVVIYDNFGNYLLSDRLTTRVVENLIANLMQRHRAGGGANYFDFCCFSSDDSEIFEELIRYELTLAVPQ